MSSYAIAVVREQNMEIRIRLLNTLTGNCDDFSLGDTKYYIKKNGVSNLELDKDGNIKWKQGLSERYPQIDKVTKSVKNNNNIVVLSVSKGDNKIYKVCNYCGQIIDISEKDLIDYGTRYKLSNCKIVDRGTKHIISAIEGTIEEIEPKAEFRVNHEFHTLSIHIPFLSSDTLEIPDIVDGKPVINITSIRITPDISAKRIKKIVFPRRMRDITSGMVSSLRNLEEITFLCNSVIIYDSAFILLKNLRRINAESIGIIGRGACEGLRNLEEVNISGYPPSCISSNCFYGCRKLKINSILKEGVRGILSKAFAYNEASRSIVIPSSVSDVVASAFDNTNIQEVDCLSEAINLDTRYAHKLFEYTKVKDKIIFKLSPTAIIGPKIKIGDNVELVKKENSKADDDVESKIKKSKMLGIDVHSDKVVRYGTELADTLVTIDQSVITNEIVSIVNEAMRYREIYTYNFTLERTLALKLQKITLNFEFPKQFLSADKIKVGNQFLIVKCKKEFIFYPVNKYMLQHYFDIAKGYNRYIRPIIVPTKKLKSLDISDSGEIRAVYFDGESYRSQNYSKYKID